MSWDLLGGEYPHVNGERATSLLSVDAYLQKRQTIFDRSSEAGKVQRLVRGLQSNLEIRGRVLDV